MPGKTVTKHAEKYEGSESKVKFNSKLLTKLLDDSANTDRCTLYEDSANLLKDERFTKTGYQTLP